MMLYDIFMIIYMIALLMVITSMTMWIVYEVRDLRYLKRAEAIAVEKTRAFFDKVDAEALEEAKKAEREMIKEEKGAFEYGE